MDGRRGRDRLHDRPPDERRHARDAARARRHRHRRLGRPRLDPRRLPAQPRAGCARSATAASTSSRRASSGRARTAEACSSSSTACSPWRATSRRCRRSCALCRHYGARLMVDEAHGAGVLGARGAGATELHGVEADVDLRMGTFSKSLASCGGFLAGPTDVIDFLQLQSRAFLFTASDVPASLGAALAALRIIALRRGPAALRARARERPATGATGCASAASRSSRAQAPGDVVTPIVPVLVEDDWKAALLWKALWDAGVFVNVALHPAVPPGRRAAAHERHGDARRRGPRPGARRLQRREGGVRGRARPAAAARLSDPSLRSVVRRSSTLSRNGQSTKCSL